MSSHPTWVRGLKLGAKSSAALVNRSHPTWVRGLKHKYSVELTQRVKSHPTWVRGLKPMATSVCRLQSFGRTLHGCVD